MAPIPIALYGMQLEMSRKVMEAMQPEYDGEFSSPSSSSSLFPSSTQSFPSHTKSLTPPVVHVVLTRQAAQDELRPLMSGDTTVKPTCEVGSNHKRPSQGCLVPRVLAFSTGVPDADMQAAVKAAGVSSGSYVRPDASEVRAQGSGQDPTAYARALKEKLRGMGFK